MTGPGHPIRLLLADVDGTLVTQDKVLTDRAIAAVRRLGEVGIAFAVTSGRPPLGMAMLIEPLALSTPIAAFNGGLVVEPDQTVVDQKVLPEPVVKEVLEKMRSERLDPWIYRGTGWYVLDGRAPHVDREAATVRFEPAVVDSYDGLTDHVAKIVGVSDDSSVMERAAADVRERFGEHVSAALSQPYYLDVTHPDANKGEVVRYLSGRFSIPPEQIATIGDMANDVLMFSRSGLSIAMGNATPDVQRAALRVTASNEDEGFAKAVETYVLPAADGGAVSGSASPT